MSVKCVKSYKLVCTQYMLLGRLNTGTLLLTPNTPLSARTEV